MSETKSPDIPIRDAASVIVLRGRGSDARVLMGQRGKTAAFMPNKYVFPGGAVDDSDRAIPLEPGLSHTATAALSLMSERAPDALAAAAIRELWEETGLRLGTPGTPPSDQHPDWTTFYGTGLVPAAGALQFVFRAITPPGRPRRFDARFFLIDATEIAGDPDDFTHACDELSHLHWVALSDAPALNLPFVTEVVLAEIAARARGEMQAPGVPFFKNDTTTSQFLRLGESL
ncbi:NUDIX hydrolase [Litoreibacter roseus]|uniref:DNA mismatch repair protein MutT n=1 Tax=Litoreibacter roseus TaxID=2601869 RepID=A0A6N6JH18_9RHOB|nr:NUDIX hydrolase [Litoreibacter roseus]GFE65414.1 DNA mismatch repair protein MutT [Litoreibacter roseus]